MAQLLSDLEVYIIAERLANFVWQVVKKWNYFERETIGKQLVRAVDSVSANIAESHGRYHFKDKQKFGYYARGSFEETRCWLRKCVYRDLLTSEQKVTITKYMDAIGPKLNALINSYKYPRT